MMQKEKSPKRLMLSEFLYCLLETPYVRHGLRPVAEQAAIRSRYRRHREIWSTHLAICRDVVRVLAESCPEQGPAVILGSGLLLDVPIEDLCRRFPRVILVDKHHPRPARQAAKRHANLELRHDDVTALGFWASLPERTGLVASLNLAAQLALGEDGHAKALEHIRQLRAMPGKRLLISEMARVELDEQGNEVARERALPLPHDFEAPEKYWKWYLAPPGELAPYRGLALEVGAWIWRA